MLLFSLKEGTNQDEFWNYWIEKHAAEYKKRPGLNKYIINRVIRSEENPKLWGVGEIWFDSDKAYIQANDPEYTKGKYTRDVSFSSKITNAFTVRVEEKVIL